MPTALGIVASHRTAPAGFNPLSIPWHSAFWASDPAWIPPADGAGVSSWRNAGTCAVNATQATAGQQPIYRASYANLNGKPALELTAPARQWMATTTPLITQPNHIVSIGWLAAPGVSDGEATICDSHTGSRHLFRNRPDGLVEMYAGGLATVSGAGRHSVPYLMLALFNGASSKLRTNGTNYTVGDVGSGGFSNMNLFTYNGSSANCPVGGMAFLGVKDSELTAQEIADLETWASTYYGVSLPTACTNVLAEPFNNLTAWTLTGTPTIVAGRTGTAASFNGTTNAATYTIPPASESARLTIGFAFKVSSLAATRTLMDLLSDSGATVHNRIQLSTIGQVIVNRGTGSAIGSTVSGVVVVDTWYYLEVQILLSDAFPSGSLIARLNGAQIFSAAPGDSKNGGTKTVYDQIRLGPSGSAANTYLVDDLYISTGTDCTFQGDHTIP